MKDTGNTATMTPAETRQELTHSIASLREAIERGRSCFPDHVITRAEEEMARVEKRLDVGEGLTVAAFVGGTGSGKSSLFNAITGLQFADAGDIRPMTEEAAACVWKADADALLDMLEVRPARRIAYDSLLVDQDHQLDGLVLLDLPDHDSVEIGHSLTVNTLLPMVDVLMWVVDPQKYGDHLIHDSYLSQMRRRRDHMIVLLNQTDTVVTERLDELMEDVRTKLAQDGLDGVPVYPVSAWEETGLEPVREELRRAVADSSRPIATAHAELDAIRGRLAAGVGRRDLSVPEQLVEETVARVSDAVGVPLVVDSLHHAGESLKPTAIVRPEKPATSMMVAIRDAWMSKARKGLPEMWAAELDNKVATADRLRRDIGASLEKVRVPVMAAQVPRLLFIVGLLIGVVGLIQLAFPWPFDSLGVRLGIAAACLIVAVLARPIAVRMQKKVADKSATKFQARANSVLEQVVRADLVEPVEELLARHSAVRSELMAVVEA